MHRKGAGKTCGRKNGEIADYVLGRGGPGGQWRRGSGGCGWDFSELLEKVGPKAVVT